MAKNGSSQVAMQWLKREFTGGYPVVKNGSSQVAMQWLKMEVHRWLCSG